MNVLKPHLQTTVWTLLKAGNTQREIERRTGVSRHTIRAWTQRFAAQGAPPGAANCPGVATDSDEPAPAQTAPPRPPAGLSGPAPLANSLCEPHRAFIEAQLRLGRNATAIYQELVDAHGFAGRYNSVKRFVGRTRVRQPEQFDRLREQNDYLEHWERKWAASRIHGAERRQVQAMFEEERPPPAASAGATHAVLP